MTPDYDPHEGDGIIAFGAGMACMLVFIIWLRAVCG